MKVEVDVDLDDILDVDVDEVIQALKARNYYVFKVAVVDDFYKLNLFYKLYDKYTSIQLEEMFNNEENRS